MKMGAPVDFHFMLVQLVAPFAQGGWRQMQRSGVLAHAHPAPLHRLHMHRPERLQRAIALIRTHPKTQTCASLSTLFSDLKLLLTAQLSLIFVFTRSFLACEVLQSAIQRVLRQGCWRQ
jgi:hypothetical protein